MTRCAQSLAGTEFNSWEPHQRRVTWPSMDTVAEFQFLEVPTAHLPSQIDYCPADQEILLNYHVGAGRMLNECSIWIRGTGSMRYKL